MIKEYRYAPKEMGLMGHTDNVFPLSLYSDFQRNLQGVECFL